jgi:hypothetical protein
MRSDFGAGTGVTVILSLSTKSSSRFKGSNIIFGGQLTRTVTLWMYFYRVAEMEEQQSVSSNNYCGRVAVNPDESSPTS